MRSIPCVEGTAFDVDASLRDPLRVAIERLQRQLRPSFSILTEVNGRFTVSGVVGTIGIAAGTALEVSPKTEVGDDWIHAVLDLLIGRDRIDTSADRAAGFSAERRNLLEVMAATYASRLERALRREGPILLLERESSVRPYLKGKLLVTPWIRRAAWAPHHLPVSFARLTPDHDFSRAMAFVALQLAQRVKSTDTRSRLRRAARALRPGSPEDLRVTSSTATRTIPTQWAAYDPAWSIAVAVLTHRSLLGTRGLHEGFTVAVEVWPLLERLLERSLTAAVRLGSTSTRVLNAAWQSEFTLLDSPEGTASEKRVVKPDGQLSIGGLTVATFEAKYKRRAGEPVWPNRSDIYQALSAAAACGSPLAVLVYPEDFEPAWWRVTDMSGKPAQLAAIGLGLFSYRAGIGEEPRGRKLLSLLNGPPSAATVTSEAIELSSR